MMAALITDSGNKHIADIIAYDATPDIGVDVGVKADWTLRLYSELNYNLAPDIVLGDVTELQSNTPPVEIVDANRPPDPFELTRFEDNIINASEFRVEEAGTVAGWYITGTNVVTGEEELIAIGNLEPTLNVVVGDTFQFEIGYDLNSVQFFDNFIDIPCYLDVLKDYVTLSGNPPSPGRPLQIHLTGFEQGLAPNFENFGELNYIGYSPQSLTANPASLVLDPNSGEQVAVTLFDFEPFTSTEFVPSGDPRFNETNSIDGGPRSRVFGYWITPLGTPSPIFIPNNSGSFQQGTSVVDITRVAVRNFPIVEPPFIESNLDFNDNIFGGRAFDGRVSISVNSELISSGEGTNQAGDLINGLVIDKSTPNALG